MSNQTEIIMSAIVETLRNDFMPASVGLDPFGLAMAVRRPPPSGGAAIRDTASEPMLGGIITVVMVLGMPIVAVGIMLVSAVVLGCATG